MKTLHRTSVIAGAALLASWLVWTHGALTQETVPAPSAQQDQGIEVLNEGPIHEAFAQPVTGQPQPGPIVPKQPPDPVDEVPPDQKPEGNNVLWIPGYWQWDDHAADFLWVSGFWRDEPPERQWVPGFWNQVDGGWQWVPGYWADAQQQEVMYLPSPPPSIDAGPSAPAPNPGDVYVPGVWVYRENRYLWRPGFFVAYNPNWVYIPAQYIWCPAGYVFVEGYWDYPLANRGLLFAPVVFQRGLLTRPNWSYTPQYVVSPAALITALFVRPAYHSYFFGDYFDTEYQRRGFVPWVDYRIGRSSADPLFTHLSYGHRTDENYVRNLRTLYAERRAGQAPRPPRTVAQVNQTVPGGGQNINNLSIVTPLRDVKAHGVKLQAVSKEQIVQEHKMAQQFTAVRTARQKAEAPGQAQGAPLKRATEPGQVQGAPLKRATEPPRTAKVEPRIVRPAVKTPVQVQRPPLPQPPQHVEKAVPKHEPRQAERAPQQPLPRVAPPAPAAKPAIRPVEPHPEVKPAPPKEVRPAPPPKEVRPPAPAPKEVKPAATQTRVPATGPHEARPTPPVPHEQRPPAPVPPRPAVAAPAPQALPRAQAMGLALGDLSLRKA